MSSSLIILSQCIEHCNWLINLYVETTCRVNLVILYVIWQEKPMGIKHFMANINFIKFDNASYDKVATMSSSTYSHKFIYHKFTITEGQFQPVAA